MSLCPKSHYICHSWMGLCSGHGNSVVIRELSLHPQSLLAKLTVYRYVPYNSTCLRPYKRGFEPCFYSSYGSIQNMLLRQRHQSALCSAFCHACTVHVLAHAFCRERLLTLFQSCFCVTARFEKSASIGVKLLYSSRFYT